MKLSKKLSEIINRQINSEFASGYLYLAMAAYFESQNLAGFGSWMKKQAAEEQAHAMKFYSYLVERGAAVSLAAIEAPKAEWKSPLEAFQDVYAHELKVTGMIYQIVEAAQAEKDHATVSFTKWFVDEQVEEEANASMIAEKLKLIGANTGGLFLLDRELGARQ
ncbi:MAG: ferritin [Nanoarchaeota archaeon]|nr:ferritin [Nanoarchaeota archaeon]